MQNKKIAFIFALPIRTNPILITMPFGLNVIQLLDSKGYHIDVYLSEYRSDSYSNIFSENVKIHFINQNYLWRNNSLHAFWMVSKYFKLLAFIKLRNKYDVIFGTGMAGVTLGSILKKTNPKSTFVYMNDEFPGNDDKNIWAFNEKKNALFSDLLLIPDEARYEPLCKQIKGLHKISHYQLPNTPLLSVKENVPQINWHSYFGIPSNKKLFLMAGGLQDYARINELMISVQKWPENAVLIIKGKHDIIGFKDSLDHLNIPDKIIWSVEQFTPEKLHSLIQYCTASICLYEGINDNLAYVGKSSGKLMRSILLGKPVIASRQSSFQFVEDLGIGLLANTPDEIANAISYIIEHENKLNQNCIDHYNEISFEKYWEVINSALFFEH